MTPRSALGALHIGALMFGLTGVFGKLAAASPAIIVFGRAAGDVCSTSAQLRVAACNDGTAMPGLANHRPAGR